MIQLVDMGFLLRICSRRLGKIVGAPGLVSGSACSINWKLCYVGYMLRIDCWEAEKDLKTTPGSDCALTSLAVDEPLEYARLYLEGNLQMWVDTEDSLEL